MQNALSSGGVFLVSTVFDLYIFILVLRVILLWVRADYYNPISQMVIKLTNRVITPLRKIIPVAKGIEWASILLIVILEIIKYAIIGIIVYGIPNIFGLVVLALTDVLKSMVNIFFYGIIAQAILSWVQPMSSPVGRLLAQITSPIMRPVHRIVPPIGGIDISPIPALIGLQLIIIVLINPLMNFGTILAFGK